MRAESVKSSHIHIYIVIGAFTVTIGMFFADLDARNLVSITFLVGCWPVIQASKLLGEGRAWRYCFVYIGLCLAAAVIILAVGFPIGLFFDYSDYALAVFLVVYLVTAQAIAIVCGQLFTVAIIRKKRSKMLERMKEGMKEAME